MNKTILTWDSTNQQYNTNFSTAGASGFLYCSAISRDGVYFIQERYSDTSFVDLYTYSGGTYSITSSYDLNPWTLSQVKAISIYQDSNLDYYVVITRNSGTSFEAIYLRIIGSILSLHVQPPAINLVFSYLAVSIDGSYILGFVNPSTAYYYSYDNTSNIYSELFRSSNYPTNPSTFGLYTDNHGSFFTVGCRYLTTSSYDSYMGFIYYICNATGCSTCTMPGVCATTSLTSTNGSSLTTTGSASDNTNQLLTATLVLIILLFILMVFGLVFLLYKINSLTKATPTIGRNGSDEQHLER